MARFLSTALVLALLGGTAAAFAITEGLKLEPSPILGTRVTKVFSPVCDCPKHRAQIGFRLRRPDRMRLEIVSGDEVVRTLVYERSLPRGFHGFTWNGRDDDGRFVPEGVYRPRVRLDGQHRTIVLPNPIAVDRTPPKVRVLSVEPRVFSRFGGGLSLRYRLSEEAHAVLLVNGRQRVYTRWKRPTGEVRWSGRERGRDLPAGVYRVALAAEDVAGNRSRPSRVFPVRLRYVELARTRIRVEPGRRFGVRVRTDARRYRWALGRRRGTSSERLLVLRAPVRPGRYALTVRVGEHAARARVVVAEARR